jgi:hypothetical protein
MKLTLCNDDNSIVMNFFFDLLIFFSNDAILDFGIERKYDRLYQRTTKNKMRLHSLKNPFPGKLRQPRKPFLVSETVSGLVKRS